MKNRNVSFRQRSTSSGKRRPPRLSFLNRPNAPKSIDIGVVKPEDGIHGGEKLAHETVATADRIVNVSVRAALKRILDAPLVMVVGWRTAEIFEARRRQRGCHPLGADLPPCPIWQLGLILRLLAGFVALRKVAFKFRPKISHRSKSTCDELISLLGSEVVPLIIYGLAELLTKRPEAFFVELVCRRQHVVE